MSFRGWKAWDAQGRCYSNTEYCACALPDTLQFVVRYTDTGREVHTGAEFVDKDRWYGFAPDGSVVDFEGDNPSSFRSDCTWKLGTMIDDKDYQRIAQEVYASTWP